MIGGSHVREDRLFDVYLAKRRAIAPDRQTLSHLATCSACAARYDELHELLDGLREAGDADFDAIFSADQLRDQRRAIANRLELVGRSARVLSFPHSTRAGERPRMHRAFPRWLAATAAAGVVAGMAAGMFIERTGRGSRHLPTSGQPTVGIAPAATRAPATAPNDTRTELEGHATFLSELELAADSPRTAELAAYDELTPHVRDVSFTILDR